MSCPGTDLAVLGEEWRFLCLASGDLERDHREQWREEDGMVGFVKGDSGIEWLGVLVYNVIRCIKQVNL